VLIAVASPSTGHLLLASVAGFMSGTAVAYGLNTRYTFRARSSLDTLARYVFVATGGLLLHNAALLVLAEAVQPSGLFALNAVKAGALVASLAWNYFGHSRLVFSHAPQSREEASE